MARRASRTASFDDILRRINDQLLDSPLASIGRKLEEFTIEAQEGAASPQASANQEHVVGEMIRGALKCLPSQFGNRFLFDCAMLQASIETWGLHAHFCQATVPQYGGTWGTQIVPIPSLASNKGYRVTLIHMPGEDRIDDVDLLCYPWVFHELGHTALFHDNARFAKPFAAALEEELRSIRLRSFADRGRARAGADDAAARLRARWALQESQHDMAHELAADAIGQWTLGPAYLASFEDEIEKSRTQPYSLEPPHPPYELRARALVHGAHLLKTNDPAVGRIESIINRWHTSRFRSSRPRQYTSIANWRLATAAVEAAFEFCSASNVPRCDEATVARVLATVETGDVPDFGPDVIVAAWLVEKAQGAEAFHRWETRTVQELHKLVTH